MRVRPGLLALLVLLLNPLMAGAEPWKAVILFTGDNGGEIAHCGCGQNPAGGLARRQRLEEQARERPDAEGRTQLLSFIPLGPEVADDPELKARVERIEPPGSVSH